MSEVVSGLAGEWATGREDCAATIPQFGHGIVTSEATQMSGYAYEHALLDCLKSRNQFTRVEKVVRLKGSPRAEWPQNSEKQAI